MVHINRSSTTKVFFAVTFALSLVSSACDHEAVGSPPEIPLHTGVQEEYGHLAVAVGPQGRFRILWSRMTWSGPVHTRGFGVDGLPLVPNTVTHAIEQHGPLAGMDDTGRTVVVMEVAGADDPNGGVQVLRLDEQGEALGPPVVPEPVPTRSMLTRTPDLSVASDGSFVVSWSYHPDGCLLPNQLYLRRYDADGNSQEDAILVDEPGNARLIGPAKVEQRSDGAVFVAWIELEIVDTHGSGSCTVEPQAVLGRWIGADGVALTPAFHIMDTTDMVLQTGSDDQDRMYVFALQGELSFEDSAGQLVLRMVESGSQAAEPAVILRDDIVLPHVPVVSVGASGLVAVLHRSVADTRVKLSLMRWWADDPTPLVTPVINPNTDPSGSAAMAVGPDDHIVVAWSVGGALMDPPTPEKFRELYVQKVAPNGEVVGGNAWPEPP